MCRKSGVLHQNADLHGKSECRSRPCKNRFYLQVCSPRICAGNIHIFPADLLMTDSYSCVTCSKTSNPFAPSKKATTQRPPFESSFLLTSLINIRKSALCMILKFRTDFSKGSETSSRLSAVNYRQEYALLYQMLVCKTTGRKTRSRV